jgi:hypothetical protein
MDAVAVAAISSGAVALATIGAGELRHSRSLREARRLSDLENVRTVLDEAAATLHETEYALDDAQAGLQQWGLGFFEDEQREKPYRALRRTGKALDRLLERLKIRFGHEHEVVKTFEAANEAALQIYRALGVIRREDPPAPGDRLAREEVRAFLKIQREKIAAARQEFDRKRMEFIEAAVRVAGAELPD